MTQNLNLTGNTILADAIVTTSASTAVSPLNVGAVGVYVGAGVPSITAPQGSLYLNTTGSSTATRAYINTTGSTTWTAITTAA